MTPDLSGKRSGTLYRFAALCLIAVMSVSLAGCDDPAPVRIGFIGGLTGRSADTGEASRNAVQMAVESVNRAGGIDGRKIELLVRNDADDPAVAAREVRNLHALGVTAIIGPNNGSIGAGMLPAINELKLVTVSPTVSSLVFIDQDDYLFRINSTTRDNAQVYAEHYTKHGIMRVAAAIDINNKVFSESWLNEFSQKYAALGGEVIDIDQFDANSARGYSDTAKKLLQNNPQALLLVANSVDAAQLAQQIRKLNRDILLIAAEWAASEKLLFLGGSAIEGLELVQSYDRTDQSERYVKFRTEYKNQFQQEPGFSSIAAYDAATMLFAALARQKDGGSLKDAMLALGPMQGLQQQIEFNKFGDARRQAVFVVVKDGQFKPL